jgi:hypothetical protein
MPPREIGMPESEVLEPAEMEFVSGQLPRPQKDARDPHQLVAWRDDKGVLAAYRRRPRNLSAEVGARRSVAKVGQNVGPFRAMLVLIETVGGGPDGTRFKQRTEGTTGIQCLPFSKSKRKFRFTLWGYSYCGGLLATDALAGAAGRARRLTNCFGSIGLPHLWEGDSNDVVFPVLFCFGVLQHLV